MEERELDRLLNEALNSVPLAQLPEGFNERLLAKLPARAPVVVRAPQRFQVGFLDVSLSAIIALSMVSVTVVALWLLGLVSGPAVVAMPVPTIDWTALRPLVENNIWLVVLAGMGVSGAVALVGATIMSLWDDRPVYVSL